MMRPLIWLHEDCLRASHNLFAQAPEAKRFHLGRRIYERDALRPETPRVYL